VPEAGLVVSYCYIPRRCPRSLDAFFCFFGTGWWCKEYKRCEIELQPMS
jgi:hypothetical protein